MEPFRRLAINNAKRLLQPQKQIPVKAVNVHTDEPLVSHNIFIDRKFFNKVQHRNV